MPSQKNSKIKFGLFKYTTENIGDEIQSIAARRFLPQVDYLIDRDAIDELKPKTGEKVKVIMNGWYTHRPENWPPKNAWLDPLLIAVHIDRKNPKVAESFLSRQGQDFIKKFGPLGARDKATEKLLKDNKLPTYFSGCVTLTLQRDTSLPRQDFILAVDVSPKMLQLLRAQTNRQVIDISTYYDPDLPTETRFSIAEYFLYLYQSAFCVVTTRLHAALPSLAFETPILLIKDKNFDKNRYSGLSELVHNVKERDYLKDPKQYDIDNPPRNSNAYLEIRNQLIKTCKAFTRFDNPKHTFRTINFKELYASPHFIALFTKAFKSTHQQLMLSGDKAYLDRLVKLQSSNLTALGSELDKTQQALRETSLKLDSIINSPFWKVTAPLRAVRKKIRRLLR